MALRPRFVHFLFVAACACAALVATPFANSQSPATPPVSQPQANEKTGFGDNPEERRMTYSIFMMGIFREEEQIEQALQEGKTPRSRMHFQFLSIRQDEEQAMRAIIVDAERRIDENDRQGEDVRLEVERGHTAEAVAKVEILRQRRSDILDETIAKLRQELGEEDFKKLDAWVYRIYGYHPKLSQAAPAKSQGSEQPAPSLATPAMTVHA